MKKSVKESIEAAAECIRKAKMPVAFTGAGISVESGIPPFRGKDGIWNRYDQRILELQHFKRFPGESWKIIKEIFYSHFENASPNAAHRVLAEMEAAGYIKFLITQNIDNLHARAGTRELAEFHGNSRMLVCLSCGRQYDAVPEILADLPPLCRCGGILKPDFIFFGEGIQQDAYARSNRAVEASDCLLIIGSTGEVFPAAYLPRTAKRSGAVIIEINPSPSAYTDSITDVFIPSKAVAAMTALAQILGLSVY